MNLEKLFLSAKINTSHGDNNKDALYSLYKKEICKFNFPPEQYEAAIKKLCDILDY